MILGKSLLNSCEDKEFAKMSLIKIQPEFSNMYPSRFLYVDNELCVFAIFTILYDLLIVPADENRGVYESELPKKKVQIGKNVLY